MAMASGWLWTAAASVLLLTTGASGLPSAGADLIEANLEVVGRSDLDGAGLYGDVAVVGTTAVVASNTCPTSAVKVVDVKEPRTPQVVASIPLPPGTAVADVDAVTVLTPSFTGDLVALAIAPCSGAGAAVVAYHDVTDAGKPRALGQTAACPRCGAGPYSVSLAQRADGRVLAARADSSGTGVAVDDVTDPLRPALVGHWPDPGPAGAACATGGATVSALLHRDGERALAVFTDGRIYDIGLTDPAQPSAGDPAPAPPAGRAGAHAAVLPLGNRTVAIVAEDGLDDACLDMPAQSGLRVLALDAEAAPQELDPVRFPGTAAPGRLVASGELAYVTWHGAGLRVIDFGQVRPRTVAQFAPSQPDVVGVALLSQHIVVTDLASGLYVLERPEEAGARATFWSQFLSLLPYLGFPVLAAAMLFALRVVRKGAAVPSGSTVPSPGRVA